MTKSVSVKKQSSKSKKQKGNKKKKEQGVSSNKKKKSKTDDKNKDIINSRYLQEESLLQDLEEQGLQSQALQGKFIKSNSENENQVDDDAYITFTSKFHKRTKKNDSLSKKSPIKKTAKEKNRDASLPIPESLPKKLWKKSLTKKSSIERSSNEKSKSQGLILKNNKVNKKKVKRKTNNIYNSIEDGDDEQDIKKFVPLETDHDEFEDSNFLKGKSLWTEDSFNNKKVSKSNNDIKIYKRKKSKFGEKNKNSKSTSKNKTKETRLEGLPVKNDTLDKFAKLQKRTSNVHNNNNKKSGRNNSLISLKSALSNKSNK